jgi:hypothetical protein
MFHYMREITQQIECVNKIFTNINAQHYIEWSNYVLLFSPLNKIKIILILQLECSIDVNGKILPCILFFGICGKNIMSMW